MHNRRFAGKRDLAAALILIGIAAVGFILIRAPRSGGDPVAEVVLDGAVVQRMALSEDQDYSLPQNPQVRFQVRDGRCAFIHSNCPDQICVKSGFIGEEGQTAACLPNRTLLRIVAKNQDPDAADTVAY